jgi:hypothetical protein
MKPKGLSALIESSVITTQRLIVSKACWNVFPAERTLNRILPPITLLLILPDVTVSICSTSKDLHDVKSLAGKLVLYLASPLKLSFLHWQLEYFISRPVTD